MDVFNGLDLLGIAFVIAMGFFIDYAVRRDEQQRREDEAAAALPQRDLFGLPLDPQTARWREIAHAYDDLPLRGRRSDS